MADATLQLFHRRRHFEERMVVSGNGRLCPIIDISHSSGHCFTAPTPEEAPQGDDLNLPDRSVLRLFEDGIELGPSHSLHDQIIAQGGGRFSHWGRWVMFSTSDGSDPRTSGRSYQMLYLLEQNSQIGVLTTALSINIEALSREERYDWGERAFSVFAPDVKLSEFGRSIFFDAEFISDYERFDRSNYRSFDRKFAMKELLKLALPLEGDLAECGVFRGASAFLLAKGIAARAPNKRLHLFDSFAGLSAPRPDLDGAHWHSGDLACNLADVASNLKERANLVVFHPGWIPERFSEVSGKNFCFVHIDVDLFEPTRDALTFFGPRMVPGGLMVCDDYGFETCPGARRAMDEFADAGGQAIVHLPTGQGVIIAGR
jgi:O-methyltransferase